MTEYIIVTTNGKSMRYAADSVAHAKLLAEGDGYRVKYVTLVEPKEGQKP